mgnify:CR=1 FL=1
MLLLSVYRRQLLRLHPTAVFGVRGANGVVLVTTRRGKSGKPTINVSTITGVQQPLSYVQQTGSYEFARYWNMKQQNDRVTDKAMYFTREAIEAYRTGSDPIMYPNTKWSLEALGSCFCPTLPPMFSFMVVVRVSLKSRLAR